jgi:hypothetical protein
MFAIKDWETYCRFTTITGIVESERYILFGTNGAGILRFDKFENRFIIPLTRSNGLRSNTISKIYSSKEEAENTFKSEIGIETARGSQVFNIDQLDEYSLRTNIKIAFEIDKKAKVFEAIEDDNLPQFESPYFYETGNFVRGKEFDRYKIKGKYIDQNRGVWLIAENFGLFYAETESSLYRPYKVGPLSKQIHAIAKFGDALFLAQSGSTTAPVLTRWDESGDWKHWQKNYVTELQASRVNRVIEVENTLWLATDAGLISFDPKAESFKSFLRTKLYAASLNDLFHIGNDIFLATSKGLFTYQLDSKTIDQIPYKAIGTVGVLSVAANEKYIFVVTRFGVYRIDREENELVDFSKELSFQSLKTSLVRYINGKFWFNNTDGIYYYNPEEDEAVQIVLTSASFQLGVLDIEEDSEGNLFVGTNKGLLINYAKQDRWVWLTKREGLPSNSVTDVLLEADSIVIATLGGISRFFWKDISRF